MVSWDIEVGNIEEECITNPYGQGGIHSYHSAPIKILHTCETISACYSLQTITKMMCALSINHWSLKPHELYIRNMPNDCFYLFVYFNLFTRWVDFVRASEQGSMSLGIVCGKTPGQNLQATHGCVEITEETTFVVDVAPAWAAGNL